MANKKISELPYINVTKISGNTLVPLVTYFSAATGDTVHTYANDLKSFITSGISGNFLPLSGGTVSGGTRFLSGLTANTISATTYFNLPSSTFSGGTVTGPTIFTNGLTANTISATTYQNLPTDIRVTGATYSNNTFTYTNNTGGTFSTLFNTVTGLTVNGGLTITGNTSSQGLTATTISATTYQNLPTDIRVTGGTYSAGTISFTNNTGGTFNVTGLTTGSTSTVSGNFLPLSGGTVTGATNFTSGVTINSLTATTITNTYLDNFYIRDSGGTVSIDNTTRKLLKSDGFTTSFDWGNGILTGQTNIGSSTISATTYQNLPTDVRVTGGTYSAGTVTFTNNTGGTFNVTGLTTGSTTTVSGNFLPLSGGTVTGATNFTSGLTANIISANTITITDNIDSTNRQLLDENGFASVVYTSQRTLEDLFGTSLDWGGKYLYKSDASISFDWENGILTGQTNIESATISATTYLNLPSSNVSGEYLPLSGGTVTGGTIFTSGVTANTISNTTYIDFTTGTTNPSAVGGRVFFDNTSKSLTYYDIDNNNVPIAMGQQLYVRGNNATGSQINKGSVVMVTGTTNTLPSIVLATNNHTQGSPRPIGLAAENIPSGSDGLVIVNGILSGITLNTFANGDTLYLSTSTPGGYVNSTSSLPFSARTNEIGYVLQTGTTTGKIYVNINNEDSNLTLTDIERNILEGNVISTGVYEYTGMSVSSSTTINVAPARGWIVNNTYNFATLPDVTNLYYSGGTGITITNIATADATYILLTSAATITQQTTFPTPQQRRENILLGKVVHPSRTSILNVNNTVDFDVSPMSALRDLWTPIRLINQGVIPSANTGLTINTTAGTLWGNGIGWVSNQLNPDSVSISAKTPASFFYRTQTGGTSGSVSVIDPTKYDVGGVITSMGGAGVDDSSNQRIYLYPTGVINILYGQHKYNNLAAAVAAIQSETFVVYPNAETTGILIGVLSVRNDIVADGESLTNTDYAKFTLVSKFGESFGGTGGLSTTTLQQAYNNSTTPEITTDSTLGPLSVKNGAGTLDNVTNVFEGVNATGTTTSIIRADGLISGSTISTPSFTANTNGVTTTTISATTYQNLPSGNLVVGTTQITSGTSGNVLFQTGTTLQQNSNLYWDNANSRLSIGQGSSPSARLDVRAQGVLSTDIAFRVRNNGDTANIVSVQGNNVTVFGSGSADADDILIRAIQSTSNYFKLSSQGGVAIGSGSTIPVAGSNNTAIAIGLGSQSRAYFTNGGGVAIGQSTYADANSVSIGTLAKAGLTAGGTNTSISIGYNTQTNASGGDRGIAIGSNAYGGLSNSDVISIGTSVTQGNFSSARNTFIGQYITGAISQTDMVVLGGGTGTGASAAQPTLINSFSVYLGNTQRSFFVNKNSNVVLRSLQSLTSGTDFDSSATNTITIHSGTTPTTNITDAFQQYSADITAGNAAPHFRTENGSIVKIYQETTGVTSSTLVSNGGTTITNTDTFDGYTLQKVVKALRNLGILQ
jgi:hypothetical protein